MNTLNTRYFGKIEIENDKIITFDLGIPGFEEEKTFILLWEEEESLFFWLQSTTNPDLALVLVDVFSILNDYNPLIDEKEFLDLGNEEDFFVYTVATIPDDMNEATINLRAPIVINHNKKKGKQIIINNDEYPLRYKFIQHIKKNNK